jgi:hypothetical protein
MNVNHQEFVNYVLSFYGPGQIYGELKFKESEVKKAIQIHNRNEEVEFIGDSVDREMVRDIVLDEIRSPQ